MLVVFFTITACAGKKSHGQSKIVPTWYQYELENRPLSEKMTIEEKAWYQLAKETILY